MILQYSLLFILWIEQKHINSSFSALAKSSRMLDVTFLYLSSEQFTKGIPILINYFAKPEYITKAPTFIWVRYFIKIWEKLSNNLPTTAMISGIQRAADTLKI